ncbi:MAG: hypothetical protein KDE30_10105 [Novosphingobium sp.]|jgi:hypothetical protein|nr:hypothetical protein [Novosphingobium sp.]
MPQSKTSQATASRTPTRTEKVQLALRQAILKQPRLGIERQGACISETNADTGQDGSNGCCRHDVPSACCTRCWSTSAGRILSRPLARSEQNITFIHRPALRRLIAAIGFGMIAASSV